MLPGLVGEFGVNYHAIQLVFEVYDVPIRDRQALFEKALVVAEAILEKRADGR